MSSLDRPLILDASVLVKCFVEEKGSSQALALLEDLLKSPARYVFPELIFFELSNILNRLIKEDEDPRHALYELLVNGPVQRVSMTPELVKGIRKFQKVGLSGYDAAYVALAELVGGLWVTADSKAHNLVSHLGLSRPL